MAKLLIKPTISLSLTLELNETEARALDALVGYGVDDFLKVFYEKLGRHYMEPHESGLRSLFVTFREVIPGQLHRVDEARKEFNGKSAKACASCSGCGGDYPQADFDKGYILCQRCSEKSGATKR